MIKKNLARHSMAVCDIESRVFGVRIHRTPINTTIPWNPRPQRWVLKIHGLPHNNVLNVSSDVLFYVKVELKPNINVDYTTANFGYPSNTNRFIPVRQTWSPVEIKLIDTISDVNSAEFLRDWMSSDRKLDTTLERLDPTGVTLKKWQLYGSFIQEMHHEIVYDRTIGDITIRLNYDYANLIF